MYSVIAASQKQLLESIQQQEVEVYEQLCQDVGRAGTQDYQRRYKTFWAMNRASPGFCSKYFELLAMGTTPHLAPLLQELEDASMRRNGTPTVQFSFATKLLHTRNAQLPIYDSRVARFYLFEPPLEATECLGLSLSIGSWAANTPGLSTAATWQMRLVRFANDFSLGNTVTKRSLTGLSGRLWVSRMAERCYNGGSFSK